MAPSTRFAASRRRQPPGPEWTKWTAERWRLLSEALYQWDEFKAHPDFAGCGDCEGGAACVDRKYRSPPLGWAAWPSCPGAQLADPFFLEADRLWRASQVSALAGWPDAYAPWAVDALLARRAADEASKGRAMQRQIDEAKAQASTGGSGGILPPLSRTRDLPRAHNPGRGR